MSDKDKKILPECSKECIRTEKACKQGGCRMWIDFPEEQNCSLVSIYQKGSMTLEEVSKRLGVSFVRVSQIEKQALKKLSKRIKI
tara:strand:- start:3976 stop:4230 length:255 start_codon:yes stop_codon:yes gene_type:complete